ncbi:UNVERIFIED_CONTAM: hypothetical protein FKN15_009825 [Acipenser sinensis]
MPLAFKLFLLTWLWPIALLNGSNFPDSKKQTEVPLNDHRKQGSEQFGPGVGVGVGAGGGAGEREVLKSLRISEILEEKKEAKSSGEIVVVSTMPLAFKLFLLTWLWPIALLNGSNFPDSKKQTEVPLNDHRKQGSRPEFRMKKSDSTKSTLIKSEQLLRIEEHDFAMRPGFGSNAIPVGIDVQVESIDSISEVNMDFTMTLYLRHYWKDERLSFPSTSNKSRTFDGRLVKKIWVPDVFFVHSKRSFIHDTTMENIMLRVYPDGNILYSVRITVTALCSMDFSRFPLDKQNCSLELESYAYNEKDLMLYWKNGNDSLGTEEILLSQFFIEQFNPFNGLAFYSSTGKSAALHSIPVTYDTTQAMAFDGCFHDNDIDLTAFSSIPMNPEGRPPPRRNTAVNLPSEGHRLRRTRSLKRSVEYIINNSHIIDSYSRILFPFAYVLFNIIYWSLYS